MKRAGAIILVIAAAIGIFWQIRRHGFDNAPPSVSNTGTASGTTEASGRHPGPFRIGGNDYRVVLQEKPRLPGLTQETGNTVVKMEIRDSAGAVQYEQAFPVQTELEGFSDAWSVTAMTLTGRSGTGLMINYVLDSEPSAPTPENDSWWQLFGVIDGKLKAFSNPISVQGDLLPNESPSDVLQFKLWAHHYRLIFPVAVNWAEGKLSPAMQCDACEYHVLPEPESLSDREDLTFVRLCPAIEAPCANPKRTLVTKDSTIELVAGRAAVQWNEGSSASGPSTDPNHLMANEGSITVPENVWLKVRIDGKEGWLNEEEDFTALRLPFEQ
jgi:hypothetical protein